MSLDESMKALKFDSRMIEYNLTNGVVTREEYDAYLKSLPDDTAKSMPLTISDVDDESALNHH